MQTITTLNESVADFELQGWKAEDNGCRFNFGDTRMAASPFDRFGAVPEVENAYRTFWRLRYHNQAARLI
jgi:hypothetical protein